jgi:hypothetical protein
VAPNDVQAWLSLRFEPGTDDADAERLTRRLRSHLVDRHLLVGSPISASPVGNGQKSGSKGKGKGSPKGGATVAVGELIVTLNAAAGVITALIGVLRDWLDSHLVGDRITLTIDNDTVELERDTSADRERLIEAFIHAHDLMLEQGRDRGEAAE